MRRPLLFLATDLHGYTQITAKDRNRALISDLRDPKQSFRCNVVFMYNYNINRLSALEQKKEATLLGWPLFFIGQN